MVAKINCCKNADENWCKFTIIHNYTTFYVLVDGSGINISGPYSTNVFNNETFSRNQRLAWLVIHTFMVGKKNINVTVY